MANRADVQSRPAASHPHPLQTIARLGLFAMLLTAVLYLLLLQIEPGAPFRQGGHPSDREAFVDNLLSDQDDAMRQAAGDGNLELHFAGSPEDRLRQATRLGAMYFDWNYQLYPHRVFVGKGDRVINNSDQMFAADIVPDDRWLRAHGVASVLTLVPGAGISLESATRKVP